jgi:signal transduction histidine kinase
VTASGGEATAAWALLEEDGRLRASEPFRRLLGVLPPGPHPSPEALLRAAGFAPGGEGAWERGEERVALTVAPVPGGRILGLSGGGVREQEVRVLRIAAHDIRGPLANVRSYAGLLLGGRYTHEPRVERSLHVVRRNADKALALVEDAIDGLRLDRAGLPVEPSAVPLRVALDKALQRSEDRAEPSPATLAVGPLPEPLPEVWAEADRLIRVLYAPLEHLLSRAPAGSRLALEVDAPGTGDAGPGRVHVRFLLTPSEGLPREPFARLERTLEERKLEDPVRLDVARRLAESWGGGLSVHAPGGGAARGFLLALRTAAAGQGPEAR